jgi:hypothetical protein
VSVPDLSRSAARALLRSDGPTEAVTVMLPGGLVERGLSQAELVGLGRAIREHREHRENEQLAQAMGLM